MASKRGQRRRQCSRKKRYPNERIARAVANDCYRKRQVILNAYRCSFCSGWHVGHNEGMMRRLGLQMMFRRTRRKI